MLKNNYIGMHQDIQGFFSKCLSLFFMITLFSLPLQAQHYGATMSSRNPDMSKVPMVRWKFFGSIGASAYGGELTGRRIVGHDQNSIFRATHLKPSFGLGIGYKLNDRIMLRAQLTQYTIMAKESNYTKAHFGRKENYMMKATNYEFALVGQFNIFPYRYLMGRRTKTIPYLLLGIGATSNTTKGYYNGEWQKISHLSNGQIQNHMMVVVPFGAGILYRLSAQWDLGLEGTIHYTLGASLDGDHRDGISTALLSEDGKKYYDQYYDPNKKTIMSDNKHYHDMYAIAQIRLQYTIISQKHKTLFNQNDLNSLRTLGMRHK